MGIVPDKNLNPDSEGVRILNASSAELIKVSNNNLLDVHLYRAETRFFQNSDDSPKFNKPFARDSMDVYVKPLRVNQECSLYSATLGGITGATM